MAFNNWIRRLHVYAGLLLYLPLVLFAASGYMLNHRWYPWNNWDDRVETETAVTVRMPDTGSRLEQARNILHQVGADGEINFLEDQPDRDRFVIHAQRPGRIVQLSLAPAAGTGTLKDIRTNAWSLMNQFHIMSGLHSNHQDKKNWIWTLTWSLFMDISALILLFLLGSGLYMWLQMKRERRIGLVLLEIGVASFLVIIWAMIRL